MVGCDHAFVECFRGVRHSYGILRHRQNLYRGYPCFQVEPTTKGVCNMIRTRPSFRSVLFGCLPQSAHMKLKTSHQGHSEKMVKRLYLTSKMADNR